MKSHVTAVPRLTSGKLVGFSKQDSPNTKKKLKKLVPKISPGLKEKHLHQRLTNRLSLSMSRQTTTSSIGTKPRSLTKKQTKPLAGSKKPYGLGAGERTQWTRTRGHTNWTGFMTRLSTNGNLWSWCRHHSHQGLPSSNSSSRRIKWTRFLTWIEIFWVSTSIYLDLYNRIIFGYIVQYVSYALLSLAGCMYLPDFCSNHSYHKLKIDFADWESVSKWWLLSRTTSHVFHYHRHPKSFSRHAKIFIIWLICNPMMQYLWWWDQVYRRNS